MKNSFILSYHAACRWFERCSDLDFASEIESCKRDKRFEKLTMVRGNRKRKVYATRSGARLIVEGVKVITVLG